jgi:hypothetical protein
MYSFFIWPGLYYGLIMNFSRCIMLHMNSHVMSEVATVMMTYIYSLPFIHGICHIILQFVFVLDTGVVWGKTSTMSCAFGPGTQARMQWRTEDMSVTVRHPCSAAHLAAVPRCPAPPRSSRAHASSSGSGDCVCVRACASSVRPDELDLSFLFLPPAAFCKGAGLGARFILPVR